MATLRQKLVDPDVLPGLLETNPDQGRRFAVVDRQLTGGRVDLAFIRRRRAQDVEHVQETDEVDPAELAPVVHTGVQQAVVSPAQCAFGDILLRETQRPTDAGQHIIVDDEVVPRPAGDVLPSEAEEPTLIDLPLGAQAQKMLVVEWRVVFTAAIIVIERCVVVGKDGVCRPCLGKASVDDDIQAVRGPFAVVGRGPGYGIRLGDEIAEPLVVGLDQDVPVLAQASIDSQAEVIGSLVLQAEVRRVRSSVQKTGRLVEPSRGH